MICHPPCNNLYIYPNITAYVITTNDLLFNMPVRLFPALSEGSRLIEFWGGC